MVVTFVKLVAYFLPFGNVIQQASLPTMCFLCVDREHRAKQADLKFADFADSKIPVGVADNTRRTAAASLHVWSKFTEPTSSRPGSASDQWPVTSPCCFQPSHLLKSYAQDSPLCKHDPRTHYNSLINLRDKKYYPSDFYGWLPDWCCGLRSGFCSSVRGECSSRNPRGNTAEDFSGKSHEPCFSTKVGSCISNATIEKQTFAERIAICHAFTTKVFADGFWPLQLGSAICRGIGF